MEKLLTLFLALLMAIALTACNTNSPSANDPKDYEPAQSADSKPTTAPGSIDIWGILARAGVEDCIVAYLSVYGVTDITLCGGIGYAYAPADERRLFSDTWTIKNPTMEYDALKQSLSYQLRPFSFTEDSVYLVIHGLRM